MSEPFDPIWIAQKAWCRFAKRADSIKFSEMKDTIKEAIEHKGFSIINIHQACPSFKRW